MAPRRRPPKLKNLAGQVLRVEVEVPGKLRMDMQSFDKMVDRSGPRVATRARKALRKKKTYEGETLPAGKDGKPIDLKGETKTLLGALKYNKRNQSVEPTGRHPTCKKWSYGLLQILMSGIGKGKKKIRDTFDALGATGTKIYDDAAEELQKQIDKAHADGRIAVDGTAYRIIRKKKG